MAILRPDTSTTLNGVKINEYLLTKHNPNHIDMPSVSMEGKVIGVTVHNTDWISVASGTTPAEQYTRAESQPPRSVAINPPTMPAIRQMVSFIKSLLHKFNRLHHRM